MIVAPVLAIVGLGGTLILLLQNYSIVTGTDSAVVNLLPWLIVVAAVGGFVYALWMRATAPQRYAGLATLAPVTPRADAPASSSASSAEAPTSPAPTESPLSRSRP
jgi:hypothetical protein